MLSIKKIMVPYDFSAFSREALMHGLTLARRTSAELHVMHVELPHGVPLTDEKSEPTKGETLRLRVEEDMENYSDLSEGVIVFYAVGRDIAPGMAILQYAEEYDIDVVVVGTHGRRGFRRFLLGSVAEEIVRHAQCPVITVPKRNKEEKPLAIKRILLPADFSNHSEESLLYAKSLAETFDAQLVLLHVVNLPSQVTFNDTGLVSVYEYQPEIEVYAYEQLKELYEQSEGPAVKNVAYAIEYNLESDGIVQYAEDNDVDLVVMGTHGRTGMSRFLLGNVTAKTLRRITCPVFVVKSFGKSLVEVEAQAQDVV